MRWCVLVRLTLRKTPYYARYAKRWADAGPALAGSRGNCINRARPDGVFAACLKLCSDMPADALFATECRSAPHQSQPYLMSYIRHMISGEKPGRPSRVCVEMRGMNANQAS